MFSEHEKSAGKFRVCQWLGGADPAKIRPAALFIYPVPQSHVGRQLWRELNDSKQSLHHLFPWLIRINGSNLISGSNDRT
jgi:hypothetical protein